MPKPSGYTSYINEKVDAPYKGSTGILKKVKASYQPEEFLPRLSSPKEEAYYSTPMPKA